MATRYRRFRDISVSERLLDTLFLATIGLGYLFALAHLYYTHANRDGEPGLSVEDVRIAYYGSQDQTRLGSAINGGPMEANLKNSTDKKIIMRWLYSGKKKTHVRERSGANLKPRLYDLSQSRIQPQPAKLNHLPGGYGSRPVKSSFITYAYQSFSYSFVWYRLYLIFCGQNFYSLRLEYNIETDGRHHSIFSHVD